MDEKIEAGHRDAASRVKPQFGIEVVRFGIDVVRRGKPRLYPKVEWLWQRFVSGQRFAAGHRLISVQRLYQGIDLYQGIALAMPHKREF